jgi:hypothetical protein
VTPQYSTARVAHPDASGYAPPKPSAPKQQPQPCKAMSDINAVGRILLPGLSYWARFSGVTYFAGGSFSRTFAQGLGATVGGSYLYAADPQGRLAILQSVPIQAAAGAQAFSVGVTVGSATYQNVGAFLGPSTGYGAQYGRLLAVGGDYATNSAGVSTSAFVGFGIGGRATVGPAISIGTQLTEVCAE